MANYHPTDTTGQAITDAREGLARLGPAFDDLDRELAEERHMHRVEVARLVERAEAAERAATAAELAARDANHRFDESEQLIGKLREQVAALNGADPTRASLMVTVRQQRERIESAELAARSWEKRAEEAERERDQLRHQLTAAEREAERLAGVDAGLAEERDARRDAEDRADDAERAQRLAEDYVKELEGQRKAGLLALETVQRERAAEREARRDAENRADDTARELAEALRRAERAEERRDELDAELGAMIRAAQGSGYHG
jgi:chromosome segregation ATPase